MKTLITGALKYNESELKKLEQIGLEIKYIKDETIRANMEFSDIEFIICNSFFLYNDIKLFKNYGYETAIIEIDSLEILSYFEKDLNDARGTVNSFDFAQIRGLIFSTIDEKEKIYEIDIYDFYNE